RDRLPRRRDDVRPARRALGRHRGGAVRARAATRRPAPPPAPPHTRDTPPRPGTSPGHVALFFACAKTGVILLPLSWRLAAPELRFQLEDAEPALFLCEPEQADLAARSEERR